ncbi:MAG: HYR domain-containing protein, partial [Bacteroidetes bacterium]
NLQIVPNDITVPPGVLGDGINPCDPMAVSADGDSDGVSFIQATLSYGNLSLDYYTTGVTTLEPQAVPSPGGSVTRTFAVGETEVFYLMQDQTGNLDTCSFTVTVEDNTPPVVRCQPTNLFINPSGLQVEVVDASDVDNGSTDNCSIDSLWLQPSTFTCDQIGQVVNVTLSARDASGNIGTCQTIVGIAADGPQPTANSGLCGGDTLFLVANPPGNQPNLYLYQWFYNGEALSPQSNEPNLAIPGIDATDEGPYRVVITGLSGCTAEGVVNVNIESLPLTPTLITAASVCADEDIILETPLVPSGTGVQFYWYEGIAPNGTLLGTSTEPMFTVAGPHPTGSRSYYMQVEANGCLSAASAMRTVQVFNRPVATVVYRDTLVCAGAVITLGVQSQNNASYRWSGPNGYQANQQFPNTPVLATANGGYYSVTVSRGLCTSLPDSTLVNIKPRPSPPTLATNAPICEGQDLVLSTTFMGASSYRWKSPGGEVQTTSTPTLTIPDATADLAGQWALEVVLNGCVSPESQLVPAIIHPTPVASAELNPNPACQGDEVHLNGFSTVAGSSFAWRGPNDYNSGVQQPTLANVGPQYAGEYRLRVTTAQGCQDSITQTLVVLDDVNITGISDNVPACIEDGFDAVLTATVAPVDDGSYRYRWVFNGMEISTAPNLTIPNVTPEDAGTYSLEVLTSEGCSSGMIPYTLDLNFLPDQPMIPTTVSGRTSFCAGESMTLITSAVTGSDVEYYWTTTSGNTIITSENTLTIDNLDSGDGTGYRVYVVRNGCASTTSPVRNIRVNPIPQLSISSNSPVCTGDIIQLQTTFFPRAVYSWTGPGGFSATVHNPLIQDANPMMHAGTYRVSVENLGCLSDTVSTQVVVRERPTPPTVRHDAPICLDDPDAVLSLRVDTATAIPGASYQWFTNGGMLAVGNPTMDLHLEVIDFSAFAAGGQFDFAVRATQNGCTSSLSDLTLVQFDTIPTNMAFAGLDTTVCSGQTVLMAEAPTVGSGRWTLVSATNAMGFSITNPDAATTTVSGLSTEGAPYVLAWTLSNGACRNYDSDQIELDVINAEQANAGDDILACADEEINLGAVPVSMEAVGFWTQDNTQQALGVRIEEPSNPSTAISGLVADNVYFFTWVVESVCGTTQSTILVNLSDPNINAGPDVIVCGEDNEGQLQAEPPTFGSLARWRAVDPDLQISDPSAANATVRNLALGENVLIWEVDEGFCGDISRDTTIIFYKLPPVLTDDSVAVPFGGARTIEPLLNDRVPAGTTVAIDQVPQRGMADVLSNNIAIEYRAPANFVGSDDFSYTALSEGCPPTMATIRIVVGQSAPCKPPSIFTPNGDNINDNFVVPCLLDKGAYPNSQVLIFNRWGDEVFRSGIPYASNWNGTYDGEDLPADTYFYVIDLGDGSEPLSGYVMIQR